MTLWQPEPGLCGERSLFEKGSSGRVGYSLPSERLSPSGESRLAIVPELLRDGDPALPEHCEQEVVRHFTRLSQLNMGIDTVFYPLGSCTMKYNPRVGEVVARLPGFAGAHPLEPLDQHQGCLTVLAEVRDFFRELTGFEAVTLQPAAGAQGELCGMMMIRAALDAAGKSRSQVLVPDSAHGTNPASSALNGYDVVTLKTGAEGYLRADTVREAISEDVAALMITNPNTLGIFEREIVEICQVVHDAGAYVYLDGANLNALLGIARPASFGADVMHINPHKTFGTPHGGGGPGAGPVACTAELAPFLPTPVVSGPRAAPTLDYDRPQSIGKLRSFFGNFGILLRAHSFICEHGGDEIEKIGRRSVLAANYLRARLKDQYKAAYEATPMHEVVLTDERQKEHGVTTVDIAKRLLDHGVHPPTVYFPLIAPGAIMIEPTESESIEELDKFADAMLTISSEAATDPSAVSGAPTEMPARRFDEAKAARKPVLRHPANR